MVNIGRFAATLSAGAGYTWSVPTFTASNLIQRPIYETRVLDWIPTFKVDSNGLDDGSGGQPTISGATYKIINSKIKFAIKSIGKKVSTSKYIILTTKPFARGASLFDDLPMGSCTTTNVEDVGLTVSGSSGSQFIGILQANMNDNADATFLGTWEYEI